MKCSRYAALFLMVLVAPFVDCGSAFAQEKIPTGGPGMEVGDVPRPTIAGSEPKPQDVVGMGAAHGNKDLDDFTLKLVRNPEYRARLTTSPWNAAILYTNPSSTGTLPATMWGSKT